MSVRGAPAPVAPGTLPTGRTSVDLAGRHPRYWCRVLAGYWCRVLAGRGGRMLRSARIRPPRALCRGTRLSIALWSVVLGFAGWAAVRVLGLERGYPAVPLVAFTPYVAAASLVPLGLALVTRRWRLALVATLVAAVLAGCVLPRWFASPISATGGRAGAGAGMRDGPVRGAADRAASGTRDGLPLRVLTINLAGGAADARTIVRLVVEYRVDLLAVQELTPDAEAALTAAGLSGPLPARRSYPYNGVEGSGLYTRKTILGGRFRQHGASGFGEAQATIVMPGGLPVDVWSVHPCAPVSRRAVRLWARDLAEEPAAEPNGPVRILLGDFNATLDHAGLRRLIATGYRDAADAVGAGFTPTWPYARQPWYVPHVTIDHVLTDERIGVRRVSVHRVPGTDHRAVFAELTLPTA